MNTGIHIGTDARGVVELAKAITDILAANVADAVQIVALKTLKAGCAVNGATISNCSIVSNEAPPAGETAGLEAGWWKKVEKKVGKKP